LTTLIGAAAPLLEHIIVTWKTNIINPDPQKPGLIKSNGAPKPAQREIL
jgi:hypothetical protein